MRPSPTRLVTPRAGLALTVNLTVPEPATLALFGMAIVGVVGFTRRRS